MAEKEQSHQVADGEREDLWGKYVEIRLKEGGSARGLVIAQAGDSISISDEFKDLEEYSNYKPQVLGTCGIVYPHTEGYRWDDIENVDVVQDEGKG